MKQALYKALNIRQAEARLVFRLLLLQFSLGLATSFLVTASYSMLLYKYQIQQVPLVYVTAALMLFPLNGLYVRLDLKLSARKLLEMVIALALVTIPVWIAVWQATKAPWMPMIIIAWNVTLYMLVGYAYWGMAALLFNVRESRRIFSVIGSGDLPAKILGYWAISYLSPMIGIEATMLCSLLFYAFAYLITRIHFANGKIDWEQYESHQHTHASHKQGKWWMRIFETPLIMYIAALSMMAYAVVHLSEFTFLSEIKSRYDSSSDILRFVSAFFAIGRMLALFFKLLFSSRIIAMLGLTRSLLFTPLIILLMAGSIVLLTFSGADPKQNLYAFGIMFMVSELLRSVIQEPTFFILFQPLNIHLRLKGHVVAKGYVYPPVLLCLGLGLWWWMNAMPAVDILIIISICIAIILVWIAVIPLIAKAYQKAVESSIQHGFFSGVALFLNNDKVEKLLLEKITFGKEDEKIHALHLLRKSEYKGLEKLIVALLPMAEKNLKAELLAIVADRNFQSAIPALQSMEQTEQDPFIQPLLFNTRCVIDTSFLNQVTPQFSSMGNAYKKAILEAYFAQQQHLPLQLLNQVLEESGYDDEAMLLLLNVIHMAPADWRRQQLPGLLRGDRSVAIRRKILHTIGTHEHTEFLPAVLKAMGDPQVRSAAKEAIIAMGEPAFRHLLQLPDEKQVPITPYLVEAAQRVASASSRQYLMNILMQNSPWHEKVIHAIWKQDMEPTASDREILEEQTRRLLQQATDKMTLLKPQERRKFGSHGFLASAINNEIKTDTFSALKLIAVTKAQVYVQRIIDLLETRQYNKLHNAIELLDITLPKYYFNQLQSLIDFIAGPPDTAPKAGALNHDDNTTRLLAEVLRKQGSFAPWTRSLAWYLAGTNPNKELTEIMVAHPLMANTHIERETKQFVHLKLGIT